MNHAARSHDRYTSFAELVRNETCGTDYRVVTIERTGSAVLIIAPHGGTIEGGTSPLAAQIAGADHNLYLFEGLRPGARHNGLHLTSHLFDDPVCLALASHCKIVIAVHGCVGTSQVFIGGLDLGLAALLTRQLRSAGFHASDEGHNYPGRRPANICNRGARRCGVQLELTADLRTPAPSARIAVEVREAIAQYLLSL